MGVPTAGLPIDTESRVLDASDKPIPGLYAAGNSAAWLDIGGGYNSGIAITRGMLTGYLAALAITGQNAAPETPRPHLAASTPIKRIEKKVCNQWKNVRGEREWEEKRSELK